MQVKVLRSLCTAVASTRHHRHDGALDCHVMNCSALAPRYEAFNLSTLVRIIFQQTRSEELHLDKHLSTSIGTATHLAGAPPPSRTLHHRRDGALDRHVVSCGASVPRFEAFNLSGQDHLPTNAS